MTNWIIKTTGAKMPASCRARYSIVRVLEVPDGVYDVPSCRSKQVIRIVHESHAVPAEGKTHLSGLGRAQTFAEQMVNNRRDIEVKARAAAIAEASRRAQLAKREHEVSLPVRAAAQDEIVAKLQRGERLTDFEYASL